MVKSSILLTVWMLIALGVSSDLWAAELQDPTRPTEYVSPEAKLGMSFWRLDAILISPNRRSAVINNKVVKVGDQIIGNTVLKIEPNHVILFGPNGKITLFLLSGSVKKVSKD